MGKKKKYIDGPDVLLRFDEEIADVRAALRDAMDEAEETDAQRAALQDEQLTLYRALAEIRLDLMRRDDMRDDLDRLHQEAVSLIDQHEAYVQGEREALVVAATEIETLEERRRTLQTDHEAAVEAYDEKVTAVETALRDDPAYKAAEIANEEMAAMAARATQKRELAEADAAEKGAAYREDPLFSYLWARRFRTPQYKALPFFRTLDNWVAGLCDYDQHYLNYDRLTQLPERLATHAERIEEKAAQTQEALEALEEEALVEAGAAALGQRAQDLLEKLTQIDANMDNAEDHHRAVALRHEAALTAEEGPAVKARRLLEDGLKRLSFPDLRALAAETVGQDDDQLVDELVRLKAEETVLGQEARQTLRRPKTLREDLGKLEKLRQLFKKERFDSPYARFRRSQFEDLYYRFIRGSVSVQNALSTLRKGVRRAKGHNGFGGRRRAQSNGMPGVFQDILWDVAVEATRASRRGGFNGPIGGSSGRSYGGRPYRRRAPSPRPRRSSGGFRTGGGF